MLPFTKYRDTHLCAQNVNSRGIFSFQVPKTHLMTETEWRNLGVQQSVGWVHYMIHVPEPHILMFRRLKEPPKEDES